MNKWLFHNEGKDSIECLCHIHVRLLTHKAESTVLAQLSKLKTIVWKQP